MSPLCCAVSQHAVFTGVMHANTVSPHSLPREAPLLVLIAHVTISAHPKEGSVEALLPAWLTVGHWVCSPRDG